MATKTHTQQRSATCRRAPVFIVVALVAALSGASVATSTVSARPTLTAYNWPVKPFGRPHPIRGNFGDPRIAFTGAPTVATILRGGGSFHVHEGIDISAPDGTAVYPVRSGTVKVHSRETVVVTSPAGRRFWYWHMVPLAVRDGQHVTAYRTVLGYVRKGYEHVHLTEIGPSGRPVNPLAPGHLQPYFDYTTPRVTAATFLTQTGSRLLASRVHGTTTLVAEAQDMPAVPVPGKWHGLPVAPARVDWKLKRPADGTIVSRGTGFDVTRDYPTQPFWRVYVRGSLQNATPFDGTKRYGQPGVYRYRLGMLQTARLRSGAYQLTITASDTRGNTGSLTQRLTVQNRR